MLFFSQLPKNEYMKPIYLTFTLFYLFSLNLYSQSWQRYYGNFYPGYIPGTAVESYDKGYLIAAVCGKPLFNSLLIKTDINGNILWQKQTDTLIHIYQILPLDDGSMIIGGSILTSKYTSFAFLMKLDHCGDTLWATLLNYCCSVNELTNLSINTNGDILANCSNYGNEPSILFCFDGNGKFKWKYTNNISIYNFLPTPNGNIFINGDTYAQDSNLPNGMLAIHSKDILINQNGQTLWSYIYGVDSPYHHGSGGIPFQTKNGSLFAVHENYDETFGPEGSMYMIKYDSLGNKKAVYYYGDSTMIEGVNDGAQINDSTFLLVGQARTDSFTNMRLRIYKVNTSGKLLDSKDFWLGFNGNGITIRKTFNGKYIVSARGYKNYNFCNAVLKIDENINLDSFYTHSHYTYDSLCTKKISNDTIYFPHHYNLIKIDSSSLVTEIELPNKEEGSTLNVYPNPFNEFITIKSKEPSENYMIEIYDLIGKRVYAETTKINDQVQINTSFLVPSIYILNIIDRQGKQLRYKIIKAR